MTCTDADQRWEVRTRWPERGDVTFTVLENGTITEVTPADSPIAKRFSSIEGFDIPGASPLPTLAHAAIQVGEAVRGEVDVTDCSVVAYPRRGTTDPVHSAGSVVAVAPAPAVLRGG